MSQQLKYVAQLAMDNFFNNYRSESDFWEIEDFISRCGNVISSMYYDFYKQEYSLLKQEKKEEIVGFDSGWLLEEEVPVQDGYANLSVSVMTFPYDRNSIGIQNVFDGDDYSPLERSNISQLWQLNYIPKSNVAFWYSTVSSFGEGSINTKIGIKNFKPCSIKKVRVQYIPSMNNGDALVPDGVINDAVIKTVLAMRQMAAEVVVDKTNDSNPNKLLQSEIDRNLLTH